MVQETRAQLLSNAPTEVNYIIVSPTFRHMIALGSDGDPLLIRWNSQNEINTWAPTETNSAGDVRIDSGSQILSAVRSGNEES